MLKLLKTPTLAGLTLASFILSGQTLPEIRMLPSEIPRGSADGNQVGSSEPCRGPHNGSLRRSFQARILLNPPFRSCPHHDSGSHASR
jgi:hypothetical protein